MQDVKASILNIMSGTAFKKRRLMKDGREELSGSHAKISGNRDNQ